MEVTYEHNYECMHVLNDKQGTESFVVLGLMLMTYVFILVQ